MNQNQVAPSLLLPCGTCKAVKPINEFDTVSPYPNCEHTCDRCISCWIKYMKDGKKPCPICFRSASIEELQKAIEALQLKQSQYRLALDNNNHVSLTMANNKTKANVNANTKSNDKSKKPQNNENNADDQTLAGLAVDKPITVYCIPMSGEPMTTLSDLNAQCTIEIVTNLLAAKLKCSGTQLVLYSQDFVNTSACVSLAVSFSCCKIRCMHWLAVLTLLCWFVCFYNVNSPRQR